MRRLLSATLLSVCLLTISLAVSGVAKANQAPKDLGEYYGKMDYSCEANKDCTIKDVHNCCGYYPECVNVNAKVDPKFVSQKCAEKELSGVCGFPSIEGCICAENTCQRKENTTSLPHE